MAFTMSAEPLGTFCNRLLRTNTRHWAYWVGSLAKAPVKATGVAGIVVPLAANVSVTAWAMTAPLKSN